MADSGVEDTGLFSVLHSLRTGPTDVAQNTAPRTQAAHLLNLEYIEQMAVPEAGDVVALVSLYSWTYLCQPPLSVNFVDGMWTRCPLEEMSADIIAAMRDIGDQIKSQTSLLRYSDATLAQLSGSTFASIMDPSESTTLQSVMQERFTNGYSLVRHRTGPGQVTASFTRSPLVPVIVPRPVALPSFSNNGQDYQILDQRVGMMDISYSTAFQFGKTLASADMAFVAALMRIRGNVHTAGAAAADNAVADPTVTATSKIAVLNALPTTAEKILQLSRADSPTGTPSLKERWVQARKKVGKSTRDINDPAWKTAYVEGVKDRMATLASAAPPRSQTPAAKVMMKATVAEGTVPYHDLSSPVSTDWAFLFNWIMDKLFLDTIPVQYLVTDPAHLPPESIRFFHVDPTWLDCMVDGALSVANHLSSDDDAIRQSIKAEINRYLSTPLGTGSAAHLPQVPLYGFFLRSAVVKIFPDLQLSIPYPDGQGTGFAPILVQKRMASDILMVLLDRLPDGGQISSIRFTQPVHQQCFSAGDSLDANSIEFMFRKVYRTAASQAAATDALHEVGKPHKFSRVNNTSTAYDWTSRCLNFSSIEQELFNSAEGLVKQMPSEWGPPVKALLTSSMTGIQLNDTVKYLEILPASNLVATPTGISLPRQIYIDTVSAVAPPVPSSAHLAGAEVPVSSSATTPQSQTTLPVVKQTLSKRLVSSSAQFQQQSLAKTPVQLNTLTGPKALQRITTTTGTGATTTPGTAGVPVPTTSASGSSSGNLGSGSAANTTSSNPKGYPPPHPIPNQFQYAIYPSTTIYTGSGPGQGHVVCFVNTTNPFPPDIVFSINLKTPTASVKESLILHEIDFRIPIGDPALRKDSKNDIIGGLGLVPVNSSPGRSARMLSNQRWVAHMDVQPTYLNLRVIPRTLNLSVPVAQNSTLSFKLNEVEIAGPQGTSITAKGTSALVHVDVTEIYGFYTDATRTVWVNQGSAYQRLDLQRN
ncbi:MAG: hypothetical protein Q9218_002143 [Villophora microphyllina]